MSETNWEERVRELEQSLGKANRALDDALEAKKTTRYTCPGCQRKNDVPVRDHATAVRAAEIQYRVAGELAKYLERLKEKAEGGRPLNERPLSELSNDELRQLAGFDPDPMVTREQIEERYLRERYEELKSKIDSRLGDETATATTPVPSEKPDNPTADAAGRASR